jgi:hypothetical protein
MSVPAIAKELSDHLGTFDHVDDFADRTFVYAKNSRDAIALLEREAFDGRHLNRDPRWESQRRFTLRWLLGRRLRRCG